MWFQCFLEMVKRVVLFTSIPCTFPQHVPKFLLNNSTCTCFAIFLNLDFLHSKYPIFVFIDWTEKTKVSFVSITSCVISSLPGPVLVRFLEEIYGLVLVHMDMDPFKPITHRS